MGQQKGCRPSFVSARTCWHVSGLFFLALMRVPPDLPSGLAEHLLKCTLLHLGRGQEGDQVSGCHHLTPEIPSRQRASVCIYGTSLSTAPTACQLLVLPPMANPDLCSCCLVVNLGAPGEAGLSLIADTLLASLQLPGEPCAHFSWAESWGLLSSIWLQSDTFLGFSLCS